MGHPTPKQGYRPLVYDGFPGKLSRSGLRRVYWTHRSIRKGTLALDSRRKLFVVMAKPRFAQMDVVFNNPPDKHGFTTFTIIRTVGRLGQHYERHVKLDDLLSSPEAARILRISVRHLYRLVKERRIKCKKQNTHLWFVSRDVQRVQLARRGSSGGRERFLIN